MRRKGNNETEDDRNKQKTGKKEKQRKGLRKKREK